MERKHLAFIALVISMLYGVGFAVIGDGARQTYAVIGAVIVAIAWIAVGVFARDSSNSSDNT